jgi:hypothetical protein
MSKSRTKHTVDLDFRGFYRPTETRVLNPNIGGNINAEAARKPDQSESEVGFTPQKQTYDI